LFKPLRPSETRHQIVAVEEGCDAAHVKHVQEGDERSCSAGKCQGHSWRMTTLKRREDKIAATFGGASMLPAGQRTMRNRIPIDKSPPLNHVTT
jgi:hypothetical protein